MIIVSLIRDGAVAVTLASALLIQACTSENPTITAQGTRLRGSSGVSTGTVYTGPYSGVEWYAEQEAAMTSDNGGGE